MHRYRIAYRITEKQIIIVRIRHVKMEPRLY
ncbi:MAG: type II toxin-antitoxin system RelE/ParE family toxin [Ginsengibacter sp.]